MKNVVIDNLVIQSESVEGIAVPPSSFSGDLEWQAEPDAEDIIRTIIGKRTLTLKGDIADKVPKGAEITCMGIAFKVYRRYPKRQRVFAREV